MLGNDSDPDGGSLSAVKLSDPQHGTLSLNSNGSFTYTPAGGYSGPDSFSYKASDGSADSSAATVTINVTATAPSGLTDTSVADFAAGSLGSGLYIGESGDGELLLRPTVGTEFGGSELPAGWSQTQWDGSQTRGATVASGALSVDGALVTTDALFGPGRTIEFVGSFTADSFQHIGFGVDFNNSGSWAMFSTKNTTTTLYARTNNGGPETALAVSLGQPHRFRIEWRASEVVYFVDAQEVARHTATITAQMRPAISDLSRNGTRVTVDWPRMGPYAGSGTFMSRVFDGGGPKGAVDELAGADSGGTRLAMSVRTGNTPTPDGTWTALKSSRSRASGRRGRAIPSTGRSCRAATQHAATRAGDVRHRPGPANRPPSAGDDAYETAQDTPLNVSSPGVLGNDSDPDGDTLSAVKLTEPQHGTLNLNANGSFAYTPAAGYSGPDSFTYRASDGSAGSGAATVTLTVTAAAPRRADRHDRRRLRGGRARHGRLHRPGRRRRAVADADRRRRVQRQHAPGRLDVGALELRQQRDRGRAACCAWTARSSHRRRSSGRAGCSSSSAASAPTLPAHRLRADLQRLDAVGALLLRRRQPRARPLGEDEHPGQAAPERPDQRRLAERAPPLPDRVALRRGRLLDRRAGVRPAPGRGRRADAARDQRLQRRRHPADGRLAADESLRRLGHVHLQGLRRRHSSRMGIALLAGANSAGHEHGDERPHRREGHPRRQLERLEAGCELGGQIGLAGRYAQYRAELSSSNSDVTPLLEQVSFTTGPAPPLNRPPAAGDDAYETGQNTALIVAAPGVLGNDSDPDGDTLSAVKVTEPQHGTLSLNANGSFTYTPAAGYAGPDSFSYKASDGSADSGTATVTLTVKDTTPPTVTINQASTQGDPTNTLPIRFSVVFSEPVSGFSGDDVTMTGTATGTPTASVTGSGPNYEVAVSGLTGGGTVIASIAAGKATTPQRQHRQHLDR